MGVHLLAFIAVVWVIVITPGVDMTLVARNALRGGRASALATALGVNAGIAVWVLAAAFGLAAVVQASQTLFDAVRLAGAGYLPGRSSFHRPCSAPSSPARPRSAFSARSCRLGSHCAPSR